MDCEVAVPAAVQKEEKQAPTPPPSVFLAVTLYLRVRHNELLGNQSCLQRESEQRHEREEEELINLGPILDGTPGPVQCF